MITLSVKFNADVWQRIKKIVVPSEFIIINSALVAVMTMMGTY